MKLAQNITNPAVTPSLGTGAGEDIIARVLARFFAAALAIGAVAFLIYLVIGAFRWLTAGDDKTQLQTARGTMTQALIGLTILASLFAIARIVAILLGLGEFPTNITWPTITNSGGPSCLPRTSSCTTNSDCCSNSCVSTGGAGSYCT